MKKSLKVFSLLLAAILTFSFSGCKKEKSSKEEGALFSEDDISLKGKTVTIGVLNQNSIPQEDDSNMVNEYQKHVNKVRLAREKEIEQKFNCNVEWKVIDNKKTLTDLREGTPVADIVYLNSTSGMLDMVIENLIIPLDEYIDFSSGLYSNDVQKASLWKGKHYGLVADWMRSGQIITYNKTMIKNAGLADPYELMKADQWTWDAFLDIARKLTTHNESNPSNDSWGMVDTNFRSIYTNFIYSNGGNFINENNGKYELMVESPEVMEAIKFVTDLYTNSKVLYNTLGSGNNRQEGQNIFRSAKAAFISGNINLNNNVGGNQNGNQNAPATLEFETGTVAYPKGPNASGYASYSTAGNNVYAIPSSVKDPKSIAAVLYNLLSIYDSTKSDYINYETEALAQTSAEQIEVNKLLSANMEYSWFINDSKYFTPLGDIYSGILTDKKSIEDSVNAQKTTLNTLLNTLNQKLSQ